MAHHSYSNNRTALLFNDRDNDFLSEAAKLWPLVKGVAKSVELIDNLRAMATTVRKVFK